MKQRNIDSNVKKVTVWNDEHDIHAKAIKDWGEAGAISAYHEEVGELMTAMSHFKRGRIPIEEVIEEIIDVEIALEMMRVLFDKSPDFNTSNELHVRKFSKLVNALSVE